MTSIEQSRRQREKFPRRALVLDDEPLLRWAASSTLSDAGFSVVQAGSIETARLLAAGQRFDLALLDVRLPDGDGMAFMREFQLDQPGCRFIMMTAFRTPEMTTESSAESVRVLDKPFEMPELAALATEVTNQ